MRVCWAVGREEAPGGGSFAVWVVFFFPPGFFWCGSGFDLVLVPGLCEAVHYTLFFLDRTLLLSREFLLRRQIQE
jgi:hypothetical protein